MHAAGFECMDLLKRATKRVLVCVCACICVLQSAKLDLSKVLLPASALRPDAAQICVMKQDHGLETGLDVHLIPHCKAALPDDKDLTHAEPVYVEMAVQNTHRYEAGSGCSDAHVCIAVVGTANVPCRTLA